MLNCINVRSSTVVFHGTVTATDGLQVACPSDYYGPCVDNGGAALSCDKSSVHLTSHATFSRNTQKSINQGLPPGTFGIDSVGGGAWHLKGCRVVAEQRVRFLNNSAIGGGGAIHAMQGSSLVLVGGLELSGNSAYVGGGVHLGGSRMQLTGGRMLCRSNIAGYQGACMYATASNWHVFDAKEGYRNMQGESVLL